MKRSIAATAVFASTSFTSAWAAAATTSSSSDSGSGSAPYDFESIHDARSELPKPNSQYPTPTPRRSDTQSSKVPLIVGAICGAVVLVAVIVFFIGRRPRRRPVEVALYDSDVDDFVFQSVKPAPNASRKSVRWSNADPNAYSVPLQVMTSPANTSRNRPAVLSSPAVGLTIYEEDHVEPPTSPLDTSKDFLRHTIGAPTKSHKLLTISSLRRHTMMERGHDDCDSLYNSFISDDLFTTTLPNSGDTGISATTPAPLVAPAQPPSSRRSLSNVSYEL